MQPTVVGLHLSCPISPCIVSLREKFIGNEAIDICRLIEVKTKTGKKKGTGIYKIKTQQHSTVTVTLLCLF